MMKLENKLVCWFKMGGKLIRSDIPILMLDILLKWDLMPYFLRELTIKKKNKESKIKL